MVIMDYWLLFGFAYLMGSLVNTSLVKLLMEGIEDKYEPGWDYINLLAVFFFWPVIALLVPIALTIWSHRAFKAEAAKKFLKKSRQESNRVVDRDGNLR